MVVDTCKFNTDTYPVIHAQFRSGTTIGIIYLINCQFVKCEFNDISFIGNDKEVADIVRSFTLGQI